MREKYLICLALVITSAIVSVSLYLFHWGQDLNMRWLTNIWKHDKDLQQMDPRK